MGIVSGSAVGIVVGIPFGIVVNCGIALVQVCLMAMKEMDKNVLGLLVLFGTNIELSDELVMMGNEDMLLIWFLVVENGQLVMEMVMVLILPKKVF